MKRSEPGQGHEIFTEPSYKKQYSQDRRIRMNSYFYIGLIAFFVAFSLGVRLFVSSGVGEYLKETGDSPQGSSE